MTPFFNIKTIIWNIDTNHIIISVEVDSRIPYHRESSPEQDSKNFIHTLSTNNLLAILLFLRLNNLF